jgi:hypothetical protein
LISAKSSGLNGLPKSAPASGFARMVGAILTHVFVLREPPIVNVIPISLLLILTLVALEETRISAAPEMKIRTVPDLVLPIHPINRATLCNRSERSVRSGLHSTYSLGNRRQFPNISNLFCSRCGSLDAQANLVEKQKRECPVASPIGLSAPGLRRLVLRSTPIWSVPCRPIRSCSAVEGTLTRIGH